MIQHIDSLKWFLRWPIKWGAVAVTYFLVCYPNPALFVRHVQHWRDPNKMIDPSLPALQPLVAEVQAKLSPDMAPPKALKTVERYVNEKVPYKFDWETWGAADYLPTLPEVLDMGYEDCDGRAVVAASILQNLGYRAELVTDFAHVWVKTDKGETMSPGKRKGVVATKEGLSVHWKALTKTLPQALAYSVSPFPLGRELIMVGVIWLVLIRPGVRWSVRWLALLLMLEGLLFLRAGGVNARAPLVWAQWWGVAHYLIGMAMLFILGWRAANFSSRGLSRARNVDASTVDSAQ